MVLKDRCDEQRDACGLLLRCIVRETQGTRFIIKKLHLSLRFTYSERVRFGFSTVGENRNYLKRNVELILKITGIFLFCYRTYRETKAGIVICAFAFSQAGIYKISFLHVVQPGGQFCHSALL